MPNSNSLLSVLSYHIGRGNGVGVEKLSLMLGIEPRQVRKLISELREEGHAVCGTPHDGYYIAETPEELKATCEFLRIRALHSLSLESKLRKIPLADLLGQLHLPT